MRNCHTHCCLTFTKRCCRQTTHCLIVVIDSLLGTKRGKELKRGQQSVTPKRNQTNAQFSIRVVLISLLLLPCHCVQSRFNVYLETVKLSIFPFLLIIIDTLFTVVKHFSANGVSGEGRTCEKEFVTLKKLP